jgi:Uma2 family endonuclease
MIAPSIKPLQHDAEEYLPESDGKPMAETDVHRENMIGLLHALKEKFRDDSKVYVTGNIFVYYLDAAGVRQTPVSPDIFVVHGVEKKDRRIYKVDEEGKAPEVVIELTSTSTRVEDLVTKHYIYAGLGVREYFLFDPFRENMQTALHGFRLEGGEYVPMAGSRLHSEVLGLDLRVEQGLLRLYDSKTGERLRTPEEAEADRRTAEAQAARELTARQAAEAKAAAAEAKAAQELAARQTAETELARLQKELARFKETKS